MAVTKNFFTNEGVSEAIGFLLIFTLVITGMGLVTLYGYPMLLQQQSSANERIMEKNMIVLQNDIKSLTYKTVPYKETSLKIEGGALHLDNSLTNPPVATFRIYDSAGTDFVTDYHPGELRFDSTEALTSVSLQNGAVMKYQYPGSTMLAQPRWFYDATTNTWVINLVAINSSGVQSKTGISLIKMEPGENTTYIYSDTPTPPIYIEYKPGSARDFSTAWDNFFQKDLKTGAPGISGSTRTYTLPVAANPPPRIVIKKFEVEVATL